MTYGDFLADSAQIRRKIKRHTDLMHEANEMLVRVIDMEPGHERLLAYAKWVGLEADTRAIQAEIEQLMQSHGDAKLELVDVLEERITTA